MRARFWLAAILVLIVARGAAAQCRVEGVIKDTTGAPVAGATVSLDSLDRHKAVTTFTDAEGKFAFDRVRAGIRVHVTVVQAGRVLAETWPLVSNQVETLALVQAPDRLRPGETRDITAREGVSGAIGGLVRASDGMPVAGARVSITDTLVAGTTDAAGRFMFTGLQPGFLVTVRASADGFTDATHDVSIPSGSRTMVDLALKDAARPAVEAQAGSAREPLAGSDRVTVLSPQVLGTPAPSLADVFRGTQFLPGISASQEETAGLVMRGAPAGASLTTFDGFTLYDGDHALGTTTAFNSDAVVAAAVSKSLTDPQDVDRVGGVLRLTGARPVVKRPSGTVEASLLSAGGSAVLPVGDRGTFFFAARTSWPASMYDAALSSLAPGGLMRVPDRSIPFASGSFATDPVSAFSDLNGTLDVRFGTKDRLRASLYDGRDNFNRSRNESLTPTSTSTGTATTTLTAPADYGFDLPADPIVAINDVHNQTGRGFGAVWERAWAPNVATTVSFGRSSFTTTRNEASAITSASAGGDLSLAAGRAGNDSSSEFNSVQDTTFKVTSTLLAGFDHAVTAGAQFSWMTTDAQALVEVLSRTSSFALVSQLVPLTDLSTSSRIAAFFVQDAWRVRGPLVVSPGVRITRYDLTANTYADPSVNVDYQVNAQLQIQGGWGIAHQVTNWVTREDLTYGDRQFWALADGATIRVPRTQQFFAGATARSGQVVFGAHGYYRELDDLTLLAPRLYPGTVLPSTGALWHYGSGNAQGGEIFLQHTSPRNSFRTSYTVSRTDESFTSLQAGTFPSALDRRHELKVTDSVQVSAGWQLNIAWVISTGRVYTPVDSTEQVFLPAGAAVYQFVFGGKNSETLPAYHRLDVAAQRAFHTGGLRGSLGVTVFNIYNRKNIWYREYQTAGNSAIAEDQTLMGRALNVFVKVRF